MKFLTSPIVLCGAAVAAALVMAAAPAQAGPGGRDVVPPPVTSTKPVPVTRAVGIMTGFDSITAGGIEDSYHLPLSTLLNEAGFTHRYSITAESGTRCSQWAAQMPELLSLHNPGVVLINCGTNDPAFTEADRDLLGQSYRQIIEAIHSHNPYTKILVSLVQISRVDPTGSLAWLPANEARVNEVIALNAAYYIPAWPLVGLVDFSDIPATVENNPDGIHPGPAGDQLYADRWFAKGRQLGWW